MKKLAVFVEGLTEQIFLKKLFNEIANVNDIEIEEYKLIGKDTATLIASSKISNKKYYILIVDVGGDSRVQSTIIETYDNLVKKGYSKIIGLRDVYPHSINDVEKIRNAIKEGIETKPVYAEVILAVMEVEAWFLAEHFHFSKFHKDLSVELILNKCSIDLTTCDIECIPNPASQLDDIYKLVGKRYTKKTKKLHKIISKLDYAHLYTILPDRVKSLKQLINQVDDFLS